MLRLLGSKLVAQLMLYLAVLIFLFISCTDTEMSNFQKVKKVDFTLNIRDSRLKGGGITAYLKQKKTTRCFN